MPIIRWRPSLRPGRSGGSKGGGRAGARPPLKCLPPTAPPNEALVQFGMAGIIIVYLLRHRGNIVL